MNRLINKKLFVSCMLITLAITSVSLAKPKMLTTEIGSPRLKLITKVETGIQPKSVVVSPDGQKVFVANFGKPDKDSIWIYDAQTLEHERTIEFAGNAVEMAFSPDGKTIYVSNFRRHRVEFIDLATGEIFKEVKTDKHPKTIVVSPDGSLLYVANWSSDTVSVIDPEAGKVIKRLRTGSRPRGMVLTKDGRLIVAAFKGDLIHEFDVNNDYKQVRKTKACNFPRHMVLSPDEETLYVTCSGNWMLNWYNTKTMNRLGIARTGRNPRSMDISSDGRWVAIADFGSSTVSLIDTQKLTHRTSKIKKAAGVVGVAIRPGEGLRIYATSWRNRQLYVLEPREQ